MKQSVNSAKVDKCAEVCYILNSPFHSVSNLKPCKQLFLLLSALMFRPKRRIPRKSKKKTAADSFLPGTPVQHSAYGAGRILAREGDRVRIRFSSGSERVFSLAAAVPNGLLSLRQESGGNAAKAD